jgi:hypothetical protein
VCLVAGPGLRESFDRTPTDGAAGNRYPRAPCGFEHTFVTSQGHASSRFRRALLSKNVTLIDAAAREMEHIGLDDALRILVVLAERGDRRFEHAAARFAGRVTTERRLSLADARYVLALAEALPRSPDAIALLLRAYCG